MTPLGRKISSNLFTENDGGQWSSAHHIKPSVLSIAFGQKLTCEGVPIILNGTGLCGQFVTHTEL